MSLFLTIAWLLARPPFDVNVTETGFGGILVILVTVAVSYLTARESSKTAVKAAQIAASADGGRSRDEMEKDAFTRAETFYTNTIDRQSRQIGELEEDLADEKLERARETGELRQEVAGLRQKLAAAELEIHQLRDAQG